MTAPIMSRFDLFFVVLDEGSEITACLTNPKETRTEDYVTGRFG